MEHRLIGKEDGWQGKEPHHHIVNVTVSGSWWLGAPDERGIPHTTMKDGVPNGYSIMSFDGNKYSLEYRAAGRPANYQMSLHAPEVIQRASDPDSGKELADAPLLLANVFNGSERSTCVYRIGESDDWKSMERIAGRDPKYEAILALEEKLSNEPWDGVPKARNTPHIWKASLSRDLPVGTHLIEVKTTDMFGKHHVGQRIIRVK